MEENIVLGKRLGISPVYNQPQNTLSKIKLRTPEAQV